MNGLFDLDTYHQCRTAERMRKTGALPPLVRRPRYPVVHRYRTVSEWLAALEGAPREVLDALRSQPERDILVLKPSHRKIIREVCDKHGLDVEHVLSDRRTRPLVEARIECYCRLYVECPEMSLPAIGRAMGGRDHTTVLHSIRKYGHLHGITYREGGRGHEQV